jgi:hypothetical protein
MNKTHYILDEDITDSYINVNHVRHGFIDEINYLRKKGANVTLIDDDEYGKILSERLYDIRLLKGRKSDGVLKQPGYEYFEPMKLAGKTTTTFTIEPNSDIESTSHVWVDEISIEEPGYITTNLLDTVSDVNTEELYLNKQKSK